MGKRLLSGLIFIPLIIIILIISIWLPAILNIFIALVSGIAVGEFLLAIKKLDCLQMSLPSVTFAFLLPIFAFWNGFVILWYLYTLVMLCMLIFYHGKLEFKDFAYTYSMTVVISFALSSIVSMGQNNSLHTVFYFVFVVGLPWLSDAGAYFVGKSIGKHSLCPKISPKKTVEGAIGGIIIGAALTCFIAFLFELLIFQDGSKVNYIYLVIIAIIGSALSILGDLTFSLIKRAQKIKDFSNIIPGHGGILDRFDSVIFVAPFVFTAIYYFPIISV